jgi:predicted Zn-ribbon and HTH transcriptional regulator
MGILARLDCKRCGHHWIPRIEPDDVGICPKCKSYKFRQLKVAETREVPTEETND